jgi:hypothetical protein
MSDDEKSHRVDNSHLGASAAAAGSANAQSHACGMTQCCSCPAGAICEVPRCECVNKQEKCCCCLPGAKNKCQNVQSFASGKRVVPVRTNSGGQQQQTASASNAGQPHIWTGVAKRGAATTAAASSSEAASPSKTKPLTKAPACIQAVATLCSRVQLAAQPAAAGVTITRTEFDYVEELHALFGKQQTALQEAQVQSKTALKAQAVSGAALVREQTENAKLTKKYNELLARWKVSEANQGQAAAAPKKGQKRGANTEQTQGRQPEDHHAAATGAHISRADDSRRQRTSGTVHPSRLQQVPQYSPPAMVPPAASAVRQLSLAARSSDSVQIIHPANHCLVMANVGARIHTSRAAVVQLITQLLFNIGLCIEDDRGATTPIDAHSLAGSIAPIHWKVVFKDAEAATAVLTRYSQNPDHTVSVRAFLDRRQHQDDLAASVRVERPLRVASEITQAPSRAPSTNSVICVAPTQPTTKVEPPAAPQQAIQRTTAPLQFTTKRAGAAEAAPAPIQVQAADAAPARPPSPPPHPQHPPPGTYGPHYGPWQPLYRPPPPMAQAYGPAPPYGGYMPQPAGYYAGPPMGYAPAGYVYGPEVYQGFPPRF